MHQCKACQQLKPISEFPVAPDRPLGIRNHCKVCIKVLHTKHRLLRDYNLTEDQLQQMVKHQENSCKICNTSFEEVRRAIDHSHVTLKVRGLLCYNCNAGLGNFKDDPSLLEKAIQYLKDSL